MRRSSEGRRPAESKRPVQSKPGSTLSVPVMLASIVSFLWIVFIAVYLANGEHANKSVQDWISMVLGLVTPLPLIGLVTYIMMRAGDLRRSALILGRLTKELLRPDQAAAKDMNTLGAAIRAEVDMVTASLDEAVRRVNALEGVLRAQTKALDDAAGDVDNRTRGISHTLEQQQSKIDNLVKTLSKEARLIGETIDSHAGAIIAATHQAGDQLKSAQAGLDERTKALDKVAKQAVRGAHEAAKGLQDETVRLDTVSEAALERASKLTSRYEAQHRALSKAAADMARENAHLDRVLENHRTLLGQIAEVTAAQAKRIEDTVVACVSDLDKAMEGADKRTATVSDSFVRTIERLTIAGEKAAETMSTAASAARDAAKEAETDLDSSGLKARESLETQLEQARAALESLSKEAGDLIEQHAETAVSGLDTQLAKLKETVDSHVDSTGNTIKSLQTNLTDTLKSGQKAIETLADGAGTNLDKAVQTAIGKLEGGQKAIEQAAQGAGGTLDKAVDGAVSKLSKLISDSTATAEAVTQAANELSRQIDRFPDQAGEGASQIRAAINEQIEQLNDMANGAADKAKELSRVLGLHKVDMPTASGDASYSAEMQNREWYPQVWQGIENQRGPVRSTEISEDQVDNLAQRLAKRLRPLPGSEGSAPAQKPAAAKAGASGPRGPSSHADSPRASAPSKSAGRPGSATRLQPGGNGRGPSAPSKAPAPQQQRPAAQAGTSKKSSGWRDILKTVDEASQDGQADAAKQDADAARASLRIIETLQAMSIDLDRALEEDPPAELLQRYLNGERNVFARRLTNLAGPQLSDRIKKQYARESEFRADVNRYLAEFETLMDTVTKQDRENILAETYLTSQTGKVYIILKQSLGK